MRKLGIAVVGLVLAGLMTTFGSAGRTSATAVVSCNGEPATIWYTGNHTINGTSHRDVIVGSDEADTINGNGGDDLICGLGGDDVIHGNTGNDKVYGDAGNDTLSGNFLPKLIAEVEDQVVDGADDSIYGGSGNDVLIDFFGWNYFDGGSGNDGVYGTGELHGNTGNDWVSSDFDYFLYRYYGGRDDDIQSVSANDVCNTGNDDGCGPGSILDGGSGSDEIVGT